MKCSEFYSEFQIAPSWVLNGTLLYNAILQTHGVAPPLTNASLRDLLTKRFGVVDFSVAKKDVAPFLSDRAALKLFEKEVFLNAVQNVELDEL